MAKLITSILIFLFLGSFTWDKGEVEPQIIACWFDEKHNRYALAIDLSFSYYPPEGQISCEKLSDLEAEITHQYPVSTLTILLSEYPHGNTKQCRPLKASDVANLSKKNPKWTFIN